MLLFPQRFQEILADPEGPDYTHAAKRRGENIWFKGYSSQTENEPDLSDFPLDGEMVNAWNKGLELAQAELQEAGIQPASDDLDDPANRWFFHPHLLTGVTDAQLNADGLFAEVNDQNENEGVHIHIGHHEEAGNALDLHAPAILPSSDINELRAHLTQVAVDIDILEEDETNQEQVMCPSPKVANTLEVPGYGAVHKSTLVAKLNSCPNGNLNWDRSMRVRYGKGAQKTTWDAGRESPDYVGLYDDIALCVREKGKPAQWKLGRVIRMRNRDRSTVEYLRPVNIHDTRKYPKLCFVVNLYSKSNNTFDYPTNTQPVEFNLSNVIMKVTLSFDGTSDRYTLDEHDKARLDEFIVNTSSSHRKHTTTIRTKRTQETRLDEGVVVVDVEPQPNTSNGTRTSMRKRRQRIFFSD